VITRSRAEYQREFRKQKKAAGLCFDCGTNPKSNTGRCVSCKEKHKKAGNKYYHEGKGRELEAARNVNQKAKVLDHYGWRCNCHGCSETNPKFLTIDHINNDGYLHRQTMRENICDWLIKNNFPDGFQVLCWNCNAGKRVNGGICPHLDEIKEIKVA